MGRPKESPKTEWKVKVENEWALVTDANLIDPFTNRPYPGARGRLINQLLKDFWLTLDKGGTTMDLTPSLHILQQILRK